MPKTADELFQDKMEFLDKAEKALDKGVKSFQTEVFQLILTEMLPLFDLEDGIVANTSKNIGLITQIDIIFDSLMGTFTTDILAPFANDLIAATSLSAEYYVAMGFKKTVVNKLLKDKVFIEKRIGITSKGKLIKGGYLYDLGQTAQVRQQLKDYVIRSLTGDVSFTDFQLGFRNLVIGNRRQKGLKTTGSLQRYFDQYAYDAFNQYDEIANSQLANGLGLEHFIYEGSIIATTRPFCKKRAGKAFKVSETKKWKDDPDLIDKKTKNSYRPLIERGRNRCRHFIKYITESTYKAMTNGN